MTHRIHQAIADGDAKKVARMLADTPRCLVSCDAEGRLPLHQAEAPRREKPAPAPAPEPFMGM